MGEFARCNFILIYMYLSLLKVQVDFLNVCLYLNFPGVRQVLQALERGSKEVRKYLLDEVNVVYECKVCMNFFR
jgi:hypothetical protein